MERQEEFERPVDTPGIGSTVFTIQLNKKDFVKSSKHLIRDPKTGRFVKKSIVETLRKPTEELYTAMAKIEKNPSLYERFINLFR